jgi:hypothetical protein
VNAWNRTVDPLELVFTLTDPSVSLLRIELVNDSDMLSGTADCLLLDPRCFKAVLEQKVAKRWFDSGSPARQSVNQRLLVIRAHVVIDGQETLRAFSVTMFQGSQQGPEGPGSREGVFTLSGTC